MRGKFIIGIDLGGTNLRIALLDSRYKIRDREFQQTRKFIKKEELIAIIVASVDRVIRSNKLKRIQVLGVGMGLPGPVDSLKGRVYSLTNIPGWKEVKLKSILQKKLRLPVFIDNDAKLMALAEHRLGAAKGFDNAICLTLGTGVGGGIIANAGLYRGSQNLSGELGHVPINEYGPRCNCRGYGCLESYIGNKRILSEARRSFGRGISLEELSSLAKKGNKKAGDIWKTVARRLGVALCGAINLLNPDCIVIGGGVAEAGKVLFDNLSRTILRRAMSVQARHVKIFKARLGSDAGLIGAAILVNENIH